MPSGIQIPVFSSLFVRHKTPLLSLPIGLYMQKANDQNQNLLVGVGMGFKASYNLCSLQGLAVIAATTVLLSYCSSLVADLISQQRSKCSVFPIPKTPPKTKADLVQPLIIQ